MNKAIGKKIIIDWFIELLFDTSNIIDFDCADFTTVPVVYFPYSCADAMISSFNLPTVGGHEYPNHSSNS